MRYMLTLFSALVGAALVPGCSGTPKHATEEYAHLQINIEDPSGEFLGNNPYVEALGQEEMFVQATEETQLDVVSSDHGLLPIETVVETQSSLYYGELLNFRDVVAEMPFRNGELGEEFNYGNEALDSVAYLNLKQ